MHAIASRHVLNIMIGASTCSIYIYVYVYIYIYIYLYIFVNMHMQADTMLMHEKQHMRDMRACDEVHLGHPPQGLSL